MQPNVDRSSGWKVLARALRGPRSISLVGCLILLVPSIAATIFVDLGRLDNIALTAVTVVAVTLGDVVVLLAADRTVLRDRRTNPTSLIVVAVVYLLAALIRPVIASAIGVAAGFPQLPATRYVGSVLVGVTSLVIVAVVLDQVDRYQSTMTRLANERRFLDEQRDSFDLRLVEQQRELASVVRRDVGSALEDLASAARRGPWPATPDHVRSVAVKVRTLSQDTVRPLSHSLRERTYLPVAAATEPDSVSRLIAANWRQIIVDAAVIHPFSPVVVPILFFVMTTPYVLLRFTTERGLLALAVEAIGLAVCLALAGRALPRSSRSRLPAWAQVATYFCVLFASTAIAALASYVFWPVHDLATIFGGFVFVLVVGSGVALAFSAADSAQVAVRSLSSALAAEQWQVHREQQRFDAAAHDTSRALHGKVQSTLSILALNLDSVADAPESTAEARRQSLLATADAIDEIVATLPSDQQVVEPWDVGQAISEVVQAWQGLVDVSLDIDGRTCEVAERYGFSVALLELVREAITNAARHGGCTKIAISANVGDGVVEFTAVDDGRGPSVEFTAGIGLGELSELGVQWSLRAQPSGGAILRAVFELPRG